MALAVQTAACAAKLAVDRLGLAYRNPRTGVDLQVLDEVSFDVHDREFVAIVGPSGCVAPLSR